MNLKTTIAAAACLAFAGAASAQLSEIGPFTGDFSESFDVRVVFTPCCSDAGLFVFDGNGDLCTPGASGCHTTSGWSFSCVIYPHSSSMFFGSAGGFAEYSFDIPVTKFGGYFGTNAPGSAGGFAIFYDAAGNQIGDDMPIDTGNIEDCSWNWNGWESTEAIARVAVHNDVFGGAFLDMDDMEISTGSNCPADCNGDGTLNTLDFLCFLNAFENGDPYADYNGDGTINTLDFLAYLNDFAAGCE